MCVKTLFSGVASVANLAPEVASDVPFHVLLVVLLVVVKVGELRE